MAIVQEVKVFMRDFENISDNTRTLFVINLNDKSVFQFNTKDLWGHVLIYLNLLMQ